MTKENKLIKYIEENTLRCEASHRGGGIEIDVSDHLKIEDAKMTAYQNYLGGGMLGSVCSDRNFETKDKAKNKKADDMTEALKKYFFDMTNHTGDKWEEQIFEQNQRMPESAY